jgi:cell cycle arrest protein BUB3
VKPDGTLNMARAAGAQVALADAPTDGIASLRFAHSADLLVATSWDTSVRLYDIGAAMVSGGGGPAACLRASYHHKAPVLDAAFGASPGTVYSGGLDMTVRM